MNDVRIYQQEINSFSSISFGSITPDFCVHYLEYSKTITAALSRVPSCVHLNSQQCVPFNCIPQAHKIKQDLNVICQFDAAAAAESKNTYMTKIHFGCAIVKIESDFCCTSICLTILSVVFDEIFSALGVSTKRALIAKGSVMICL